MRSLLLPVPVKVAFGVGLVGACTSGSDEVSIGETSDVATSAGQEVPQCGNGVVQATEECDLGVGNDVGRDCTPRCTSPACGDGWLSPDEECDPGLEESDAALCTPQCTVSQPTLWLDAWTGGDGGDDRVRSLGAWNGAGDDDLVVLDPDFEPVTRPIGRRHRRSSPQHLVGTSQRQDAEGPRPQTIFVDFDGERLRPGDDAALGEASCVPGAFQYPGFPASPDFAAEAVERARQILAPYAVRVVTDPPPAYLPHTRVMVGGSPESLGQDPRRRGFACVVDCEDVTRRELVFAYGDVIFFPEELGRTIAHEVAHSWGLDHVEETDHLMRSVSSASSSLVVDGCSTLSEGTVCPDRHAEFCPPGGQNTHAELLQVLGPADPDTTPPTLAIESIEPDRPVAGDPITLTASMTDDRRGAGWQVAVDPLGWSLPVADGTQQIELELPLPPGVFTIHLEAMDQAGNPSSASREIRVATPQTESESSTDTEDGASGEEDPGGGDSSCRVHNGGRSRQGLIWLLPMLLGLGGRSNRLRSPAPNR